MITDRGMLVNCERQLVMQAPASHHALVISTVEFNAALSRRDALTSRINDVMLQFSSSQVVTHTMTSPRSHLSCRRVGIFVGVQTLRIIQIDKRIPTTSVNGCTLAHVRVHCVVRLSN